LSTLRGKGKRETSKANAKRVEEKELKKVKHKGVEKRGDPAKYIHATREVEIKKRKKGPGIEGGPAKAARELTRLKSKP